MDGLEASPLVDADRTGWALGVNAQGDLLLTVREHTHVTWSGQHRAPLQNAGVWPRAVQDPLPVWVAVGGSPPSVARAGALGLPLTVAIIGGQPERFVPLIDGTETIRPLSMPERRG